MTQPKRLNLIFGLILFVVTLLIGIAKVNSLELFSDEIDVGYQAYSLARTGADYKGNFLPLYIDSFTESRAPLFIYSVVPSVALFGLTPFAVRLPAILFGSLSVVIFFLLILKLTNQRSFALTSSVILTLTPWFYHYSTHAFEVSLLIFLTLAGTYFFYLFLDKFKLIWAIFSILAFALTFYTYNTANIFTPALGIFLLVTNFKQIFSHLAWPKTVVLTLTATLLLAPLLYNLYTGKAAHRFGLVSIFNDPATTAQIIFKRTDYSSTPGPVEKLFHNKAISYFTSFSTNYLHTISPDYLFAAGDTNPRHTPPGTAPLLIVLLPFFILGLFSTATHRLRSNKLFIFWLILAPIPAALTINGGTHATRTILILPALIYFIALGLLTITRLKFYKIIYVFIAFFVLLNISVTSHEYFTHYPKESTAYWNTGYRELFTSIPKRYNHLYISHTNYNSLLPFLFYTQYPPELLQSSHFTDTAHTVAADGLSGFSLNGSITFVTAWPQSDTLGYIKSVSQSGDAFVLFQAKDIPGDMILSAQSMPQFINLDTTNLPNHFHLGQVIQKL